MGGRTVSWSLKMGNAHSGGETTESATVKERANNVYCRLTAGH